MQSEAIYLRNTKIWSYKKYAIIKLRIIKTYAHS
jgi:hypothetical protein